MKTTSPPVARIERGIEYRSIVFLHEVWPYKETPTPVELLDVITQLARRIASKLGRRVVILINTDGGLPLLVIY